MNRGAIILAALAATCAAGRAATNASITLVAPSRAADIPDGDEYATAVAGNPWDMAELRDIPFEDDGFRQPTVSNGTWTATTQGSPAYCYPLFKGWSDEINTNYNYAYDGGMPFGTRCPLDASRYARLSLRLSLPKAVRSYLAIAWYTNVNRVTPGTNVVAVPDYEINSANGISSYADGFRIVDIAFTEAEYFRDTLWAAAGRTYGFQQIGRWAGTLYGFALTPSLTAPPGTPVKLDWIRAYNPATSPRLGFVWTSTPGDIPPIEHSLLGVQIWVDRRPSGYAGDLLKSGLLNDGRYDLATAALPPGTYYFYLKLLHYGTTAITERARSAYSPPIRIGTAPAVAFTAPSFTSGADYATAELGNPWDMADAADIELYKFCRDAQFSNGVFTAVALPTNATPGAVAGSDVLLLLQTRRQGMCVPIDTATFRYFTYRLKVDGAGYTNMVDRILRGWGTRTIWYNTDISVDGAESQNMPVLEDWHAYAMDLWDPDGTLLEPHNPYPAQIPWRAQAAIRTLRFDPLETVIPTRFWLDDVKLCAENRPVRDRYTIAWTADDPDSKLLTVSLGYGVNPQASGVTLIATLRQAPGPGAYVWDTSRVAPGVYRIRAVVSDGVHTTVREAPAPVRVGADSGIDAPLAGGIPIPRDFDGDRLADPAVYRAAGGYWGVRLSSLGKSLATVSGFGGPGQAAVPADYDGDRKADPALYLRDSGGWAILPSMAGYAAGGGALFGAQGTPCPADYDGDRKADPAVYQPETGFLIAYLSRSGYAAASAPLTSDAGWNPAPADYDGDGKDDPALCQTGTGTWTVWPSAGGYAPVRVPLGAAGFAPLPADLDGDRRADLVAYQEASGHWVGLLSSTGYARAEGTFGEAGFLGAPADFLGTGNAQVALYQPATGLWLGLDGGTLRYW